LSTQFPSDGLARALTNWLALRFPSGGGGILKGFSAMERGHEGARRVNFVSTQQRFELQIDGFSPVLGCAD
jgi:hypothetical protein